MSAAGPLSNAIFAIMLAVIYKNFAAQGHAVFWLGLAFLAFLQVTAALLNLLPIPGLDGFNGIRPFLPKSWDPGLAKAERLGMLLLLALVFLVPGAGGALFRAAAWLSLALGLQGEALQYGWSAFFFWRQ